MPRISPTTRAAAPVGWRTVADEVRATGAHPATVRRRAARGLYLTQRLAGVLWLRTPDAAPNAPPGARQGACAACVRYACANVCACRCHGPAATANGEPPRIPTDSEDVPW